MSVQSLGPRGDGGDPDRGARRGPAGRAAPGRRWIHRRGVMFRAELRPPFAASRLVAAGSGFPGRAAAGLPGVAAPRPWTAEAAERGEQGERAERLASLSGPLASMAEAMVEAPAPGAVTGVLPALVRLSLTFGWPAPLPDWSGMAVRLRGAGGRLDDVLLVSSARGPELWRQMLPGRHPLACTFSSVVRYAWGGVEQVVAAIPTPPRRATLDQLADGGARNLDDGRALFPVVYRLVAAEAPRAWRPLGDLVLTERIDDDPTVRFRPPHAGPPLLTRLRQRLYAWSRH